MDERLKAFITVFVATLALLFWIDPKTTKHEPSQHWTPAPIIVNPSVEPAKANITTRVPDYQDYSEVVAQLKEWHEEAPNLTEIGTYGKSTKGEDLWYIRVTNTLDSKPKPKVLITASIHGNEPHSTSTVMGVIGSMLGEFKEEDQITKLIKTRDVYFIPVVSPDSYPHSRKSDGVDPNRNFPTPDNLDRKSVTSVQAVRDFFLKHQFSAVISGHTSGRVYLHPYGDRNDPSPNEADFKQLISEMQATSGYRVQAAHEMYKRTIHGTEVDWYYRNGAFPIVIEFSKHQRKPTPQEVKEELAMTYPGILLFIEKAPLVKIIKDQTSVQTKQRTRNSRHHFRPQPRRQQLRLRNLVPW